MQALRPKFLDMTWIQLSFLGRSTCGCVGDGAEFSSLSFCKGNNDVWNSERPKGWKAVLHNCIMYLYRNEGNIHHKTCSFLTYGRTRSTKNHLLKEIGRCWSLTLKFQLSPWRFKIDRHFGYSGIFFGDRRSVICGSLGLQNQFFGEFESCRIHFMCGHWCWFQKSAQ